MSMVKTVSKPFLVDSTDVFMRTIKCEMPNCESLNRTRAIKRYLNTAPHRGLMINYERPKRVETRQSVKPTAHRPRPITRDPKPQIGFIRFDRDWRNRS